MKAGPLLPLANEAGTAVVLPGTTGLVVPVGSLDLATEGEALEASPHAARNETLGGPIPTSAPGRQEGVHGVTCKAGQT